MHSTCHSFPIGSTRVGADAPVYVIAEAGVNHDGQATVARELIAAAAKAGADAVKFQVFSADRLVTRDAPAADYQRAAGHANQYEMLARLQLSHGQFAELADEARRRGIAFLATPFSVEDLRFVASLGVGAIKLASPDIVNGPLLDAAAASGRAVIASTGAADEEEIGPALARLRRPGAGPVALLHCVSRYPAGESEANLGAIRRLAGRFDCVAGFSDHTTSVGIGSLAVAAGARIIEKHLTLSRQRSGPDHAFSLEPDAFAEYVRGIRWAERLLGDGRIGPTESQREMRTIARSSIVAACEIAAGQVLTRAMLAAKRPGGGISPMRMDELVGRRAARRIPADAPIDWDAMCPLDDRHDSPADAGRTGE